MQDTIDRLVAQHQDQPGAMLPLLHAVQDELGYIPPSAVAAIARALNLSSAEVHGVISYYHHFRSTPPGEHVVQVCRAEACKAMGADALWAHACTHTGVAPAAALHGATCSDGSVTLQPVYCLGLCATAPAMLLDERLHARVSPEEFDRLLQAARSAA
ncbi:MAG: formate dehydrogenase subunit gamma [Rhodoferax sp.]